MNFGGKMYKLLDTDEFGNLVSCCRNENFPEEIRVIYLKNVEIYAVAEKTKLFVFEFLKDAFSFVETNSYENDEIEIWECETTGRYDANEHLMRFDYILAYAKSLINSLQTPIPFIWKFSYLTIIPKGSIAVDTVKLTNKI